MTDRIPRRAAASTSGLPDLPPLSAIEPTVFATTASTSYQQNTSCGGGCYGLFYLSMVGVVGISSIHTDGSPISTNEAVSRITMTQEIGTITVDNSGNTWGEFTASATDVIPSGFTAGFSVVDGTTQEHGDAYLSALSTIVPDYTSWQTIMDAGFCVQKSQVISFESAVTFFDGDITQGDFTQISGSAIATRLPSPTCTPSTAQISTTRSIPTFKAAVQTATAEDSDALDMQVAAAAKVGLSVAFGLSICLILGFLSFFLWKRHKINAKRKHATSSLRQLSTNSAASRGRGNYDKVGEPSVSEIPTNPYKHDHKISWGSYWRAPIFMLGGILAGMGLALGHHFLYSGLNMQPVDDISLSQAWVIRFGTLLAFLVKLSFAITIGTSFVQLQWLKLRQKPRAMQEIDALSSILGNILNFFDRTWLHFPVLALLATIFWLVPLLPVITPATLNVRSQARTAQTPLTVPKFTPDNDTLAQMWGTGTVEIGGSLLTYTPSSGMAQVYMPAAIGAQMLTMPPQYPNQSFHMDFFGPAVNCSEADEVVVLAMTEKYGLPAVATLPVNIKYLNYYSWVGGNEDWFPSGTYPQSLDLTSEDAARLFVMLTVTSGPAPNVTINGQTYWTPRVIECSSYNASYSVDFIYQNSEQTVEANVTFLHNIAAILPWGGGSRFGSDSYNALMAGLGSLLVGSISVNTLQQITGESYQYTQAAHLSQIFSDGEASDDHMARSIEEVFRNMTLSVVTSRKPYFTANQTVMGNVTTSTIIYVYDPLVLLLTYGLGLVLTLLCAATGLYAFMINDGSYQNIFSTFLRTTKDASLMIQEGDSGRDPRPRNLSTVRVKVTPGILTNDAWLRDPAQRFLIVTQPELNTAPTTSQQEELRQRHPPDHSRPSMEAIIEQGADEDTRGTLERHHSYESHADPPQRQT